MPTPVQNGELSLSLAQQFGIQGRYALQLDDVVVPVVAIRDEPEVSRPAAATFAISGGAGGFGTISLEAPGDGQTLVIVDRISVIQPAGTDPTAANVFLTAVGASGALNGIWRDARLSGFPASLFDNVNTVAVGGSPLLTLRPDGVWTPELGIVLPAEPRQAPGEKWAVIVQTLIADSNATVNFMWRELTPRRSNAAT